MLFITTLELMHGGSETVGCHQMSTKLIESRLRHMSETIWRGFSLQSDALLPKKWQRILSNSDNETFKVTATDLCWWLAELQYKKNPHAAHVFYGPAV